MVKYDKIYIPDEEQGVFLITRERMEDSAPIHVTYASEEEAVIVLTIEELRTVWALGAETQTAPPLKLTFEDYLASKGIQI